MITKHVYVKIQDIYFHEFAIEYVFTISRLFPYIWKYQ